jgi:hypothetical protein
LGLNIVLISDTLVAAIMMGRSQASYRGVEWYNLIIMVDTGWWFGTFFPYIVNNHPN